MPRPVADLAAPGHEPEADGLPWLKRGWMQGAGYFLPSALFVVIPMLYVSNTPVWRLVGLVGSYLAVAVLFVGSTVVMHWAHTARWLWVGALTLAAVVPTWITGQAGTPGYWTPYVTACAAVLLPWTESRVMIAMTSLAGAGLGLLHGEPLAVALSVFGAILGISVGLGLANDQTKRKLALEQRKSAALAVAAERDRIGRDLHDILGHSLTAIAVKADLAARLVHRDPVAAEAQIRDLAAVARTALADVRSTAAGMREVRVATEIAAARSVLEAAGVVCRPPSAVPPYDAASSELLGYVVREAVTNVIRHAGATTCTIEADDGSVTITDDGRGIKAEAKRGGLAGLADRLGSVGGRLTVESVPGGTTVRAIIDEEGAS